MVGHVWRNYERRAFGMDQLKPVSGQGVDSWGGVGQTLVDSLDTFRGTGAWGGLAVAQGVGSPCVDPI
eukprot:Skav214712  [mRNA]  locus=scaffold2250:109965:110168:+ [translate_table: standard]